MSEAKEAKKTKSIAFRLTEEEYAQAESPRLQNDQEPATDLRGDRTSTIPCREWIQDVVWSEPITAATWKKITADADPSSEIIAADLLSRRRK